MPINDITEKIEAWYFDFEKEIVAKQDAFFKDNKRYWQGLPTHSEVPDQRSATEGNTTADRIDVATTEGDKWSLFTDLLNSAPIPASVTCNTYKGPKGEGYEIVLFFKHEGLTYTRVFNYGPEEYRAKEWVEAKDISAEVRR